MKRIAILGSTGSIGRNALDVIERNPDRFRATCLAAHSSVDLLCEQILRHRPALVSIARALDADRVRERFPSIEILHGDEGLRRIATDPGSDLILSSMSGRSGLIPTFHAVEAGKDVAVANKESLVMAGEVLTGMARKHGSAIIPVDSEHNGIFRLLENRPRGQVRRILLTASGGPFRELPLAHFREITPEQALRHPTWSMGPKITIDSATLVNKGLEVIEARWLFDVEAEKIGVLIHPQSIVHSVVELTDGTWLAHLGKTDMRIPIHHALSFPDPPPPVLDALSFDEIARLEFRPPDLTRFPALRLAYAAIAGGGTLPTVYSSSNEVANETFRAGLLRFDRIAAVIEETMAAHRVLPVRAIDDVLDADRWAREHASAVMKNEPPV